MIPHSQFPVGASITLADLEEGDVHPVLHRVRASEPVSWLPTLEAWLVTRRDLAIQVMRDPKNLLVSVNKNNFATPTILRLSFYLVG